MTTEQEALRLAGELEAIVAAFGTPSSRNAERDAAAMLRKLVAEREADRAAMRRALEALSISHDWIIESGTPAEVYGPVAERYAHAMHTNETAITDLRQRLEGTT